MVSGEETGPEIKRPATVLKRNRVCPSRWRLVKEIRLFTPVSSSLDGGPQTDEKHTHKHAPQLLPRVPPPRQADPRVSHTPSLFLEQDGGQNCVCLAIPRLLRPQFPSADRATPFFSSGQPQLFQLGVFLFLNKYQSAYREAGF